MNASVESNLRTRLFLSTILVFSTILANAYEVVTEYNSRVEQEVRRENCKAEPGTDGTYCFELYHLEDNSDNVRRFAVCGFACILFIFVGCRKSPMSQLGLVVVVSAIYLNWAIRIWLHFNSTDESEMIWTAIDANSFDFASFAVSAALLFNVIAGYKRVKSEDF